MIYPRGHKYHEIKNEDGFVTALDYVDQRSTMLRQMRGLRNNTPGFIMERDFGTKLLFKTMPVEDGRTIENITDNGAGLIRVTVSNHGYSNGNGVYIYAVKEAVEANGEWASISNVTTDTFDLVGSTLLHPWGGGGIVGRTIIGGGLDGRGVYTGTVLSDPTTKTDHVVLICIDSNDKTRVFIDSSVDMSGAWEEDTRTVNAKVNEPSGINPNAVAVSIDTITERGTNAGLVATELIGYIAVNGTRAVGATAQTPTAVTSATPIVMTKIGHGLVNGDIIYCWGFIGLLAANGYFKVTVSGSDITLVGSIGSGQPSWESGSGFFKKVPSVVYVTGNTSSSITSPTILGSNGQDWKDNDDITLYKTTAGYYGINESLGLTPHFRFSNIDDQRKVNVYYGENRRELRSPYKIQRRDAGILCSLPLVPGFYAEPNPTNTMVSVGTEESRIPSGTIIKCYVHETDESDPWLLLESQTGVSLHNTTGRFYVTLVFAYQETDPVVAMHLASGNALQGFVGILGNPTYFYINPAKAPKGVTGLTVWESAYPSDVSEPPASDFRKLADVPFDSGEWVMQQDEPGGMIYRSEARLKNVDPRGNIEISASLGHTPNIERRVTVRPKFAVRAARAQGGIVVINEDDRTLRVSGYSEDTHMDDIFPDVLTDINGNKQKIYLGSTGELLGLAFAGVTSQLTGLATGVLFAFKSTELEFYDFKDGSQGIIGIDFLGVDSLCSTPYGIIYGGKSGIWIIPTGSVRPQETPLNAAWRNLYDGTLKTDDGTTSRVTEASRQALKIGYNPYFNEVLCTLRVRKADNSGDEIVSIRYSLTRKRWTGERKFGTPQSGIVNFFSEHSSGAMILGCPHGLLLYPNLEGYQFSDDVNSIASGNGEPIEVSMRFSIGELHTGAAAFNLFNVKVKHLAVVLNNRMMTMKVYTDNFKKLLDTRKIPLAVVEPNVLLDGSIGRLSNVQFEFSFPTNATELADIGDYIMNTLSIGFVPQIEKEGY